MNTFTLLLFAAVVSILLSACSDEAVKTKSWYLANETELVAKIQECSISPGQSKDTPNCINAKAALVEQSLGSR